MRQVIAVVFLLLIPSFAVAQDYDLPEAKLADPSSRSEVLKGLAQKILPAYKDADREKYLDGLFRLQTVAGEFGDAQKTIQLLRDLQGQKDAARAAWVNVQYQTYACARELQANGGGSFEDAYKRAFREIVGSLDGPASAFAIRALGAGQSSFDSRVEADLKNQKGKDTISLSDAVKLLRDYQQAQTYREISPFTAAVVAEDDARRYITERDIQVKTSDGATLCVMVTRPKSPARLPALFEFTIYADPDNSLRFRTRPAAANGYIGVIGWVRGKVCSPDQPLVYEKDGADAASIIDWISKQPWSDGRVGMYGGSYSGGTAWAAAKLMPKALKAIMVGAPVAPGIDVPMEGNVFWNFVYPWPFFTTTQKTDNNELYNDYKRWQKLDNDWYASGRAYRDLDKIDGTPNPWFDKWISHSDYDTYWQGMIPYREEFTKIDIPVLQTVGYYFGGPGAAAYYMREHQKYRPHAEHYMVIGPYDHFGAQTGTVGLLGRDFDSLAGYKFDPVALIDFDVLRFQWFDSIFKGKAKPAILQDHVNYQVTGANVWKHAPTMAAMANSHLRFYLSSTRNGQAYSFATQKPRSESYLSQSVALADRSDVDRQVPGGGVQDKAIDTSNGIEFISDPLPESTEMSGLFSGHLDLVTNKKDFDFEIDLYELTPEGEYIQIPPYWARASHVSDPVHRKLLSPSKRTSLDFQAIRLASRKMGAGSRVVAVLRVIKEPGRQVDFGTGKDVSDETVQDGRIPLQIQWYGGSYIDLPVWK